MRRLSKEVRWTIYIAIIVVVMGFGYWLTFTQSPDSYTPREAPDSAVYGDQSQSQPTGGDEATEGDDRESSEQDR